MITDAQSGVCTLRGTIHVSHIPVSDYLPYDGDYEVPALITSQVLRTKNKVMKDDMTILCISYHEVSNAAGGRTVTIGKE